MKLSSYREIEIGGLTKAASSKKYKTGNWKTFRPVWDEKKCIHCMRCVVTCPENCIPVKKINNKLKRLETDFEMCKGCGICKVECPVKCIIMEKGK